MFSYFSKLDVIAITILLLHHLYLFYRKEAKLKAAKDALEKAKKAGLGNLSTLEEGIKTIETDFVKVTELEEELKKKEMVCFYTLIEIHF